MDQRQKHRSHAWWFFYLFCCVLLLPSPGALFINGSSSALPTIGYDSGTNTVTIGSDQGAPPASQVITIPELATALAGQGHADLLAPQESGAWLLKANVVIRTTARLEVKSPVTWLRLDSPPLNAITITPLRGGHLLVEGTVATRVKVTSWDSMANTVDENTANERSYLIAREGGRMDILHSEVAYLGWASGIPSGLSWRERLNSDDPATGATGRVEDSLIHHNYFGLYTFEAYGLKVLRNQVYSNISYGIDPHDDSQAFEVAYNKVYDNGNHGIIFSRGCKNNTIHHNEVYANALHGIMLDRGTNNNVISDNLVYNNLDGIAIFQSSDNQVLNNRLHHNARGVRINATFDSNDEFDDISTNNLVSNNLIEDSSEHGFYLYARADRNIITGNTILRSGVNGLYIKSGGNRIENNIVRDGVVGINISGGEYTNNPPEAKPALDPPGNSNVVVSTTVTANSDVGIRILGGSGNQIGSTVAGENGNRIEANGKDGVAIGDAVNGAIATDNQVVRNTIRTNLRNGVLVTDATSVRNRISQNSITGNGQLGIKITDGAQANILPPSIGLVQADGQINGTAQANVTLELYSDPGATGQTVLATVPMSLFDETAHAAGTATPSIPVYATADREGATFIGTTVADGNGNWSFQVPLDYRTTPISALAIDGNGNTSAFGGSAGGGASASYLLKVDATSQTMIEVTGVGATVTMTDIKAGLGSANNNLVQNLGGGIWQLNANLFIGPDVTLNLSPAAGVTELRLRSQSSAMLTSSAASQFDYASFVYLRTYNGVINLDGVKVYSWDAAANTFDLDYNNGRAYLLAKYDAVLNIRNSEISYLGSADGESYGISWRDINDSAAPDVLRTRVTGEVIDSNIHHNYYGIYTFQASNMVFRGNHFHDNVRYGFDPHDFTHDVLVENNHAYNNGAHGFIISRGCNNFIFRNNKSYANSDPSTNLAHGFMLDPGSPNSSDPQAPSFENLFEGNEAYNNEGFGLRILGSNNNQVLNNNYFHHNETGVSLEGNSTGNTISGNQLTQNTLYGVYGRETADGNTIADNQISTNGSHGIYVRSNNNLIRGNTLVQNQKAGITLLPATGYPNLQNNQLISNTVASNVESGIDLRKAQQTLVQGNVVENNRIHGIYLTDNASQNVLLRNSIYINIGYGIRAHGPQTLGNLWSQNLIYGNQAGGIILTDGANLGLAAPALLNVVERTVAGQTSPDVTVEIFADATVQGQFFEGQTLAAADGSFSLTIPGAWQAANLTAVMIDSAGNASSFSTSIVAPGVPPATATDTPTPTTTQVLEATPTASTTPVATSTGEATATSTPTPTATSTPDPSPSPTATLPSAIFDSNIYLPMIRN